MNRPVIDQNFSNIEYFSCSHPTEPFSVISEITNRFKLILVEEGTGVLNIKEHYETFIAPTIFCFDELEKPKLSKGINVSARTLSFHPRIINSIFDFEFVRNNEQITKFPDRSNWQLLRPFFDKNHGYSGHLNVNGVVFMTVENHLNAIEAELINRTDGYWLQTRTLMFKLLILIQRLFYDDIQKDEMIQSFIPEKMEVEILESIETSISNTSEDIKKMIRYLNENYHRKITIDELSKLFYMNRMTLNQRFTQATGMSVKHYLTKLRIKAATFLLKNPALCITDIPESLGFYDNAHFYRIFRKYTGCSPSEYQQKYISTAD